MHVVVLVERDRAQEVERVVSALASAAAAACRIELAAAECGPSGPASSRSLLSARLPLTRNSPLRTMRWIWLKESCGKRASRKRSIRMLVLVRRDHELLHAGGEHLRRLGLDLGARRRLASPAACASRQVCAAPAGPRARGWCGAGLRVGSVRRPRPPRARPRPRRGAGRAARIMARALALRRARGRRPRRRAGAAPPLAARPLPPAPLPPVLMTGPGRARGRRPAPPARGRPSRRHRPRRARLAALPEQDRVEREGREGGEAAEDAGGQEEPWHAATSPRRRLEGEPADDQPHQPGADDVDRQRPERESPAPNQFGETRLTPCRSTPPMPAPRKTRRVEVIACNSSTTPAHKRIRPLPGARST